MVSFINTVPDFKLKLVQKFPKQIFLEDLLPSLLEYYILPCRHLLVQSQQWKHQNNVWNMFKINNKDTWMTSKLFKLFFQTEKKPKKFPPLASGWVNPLIPGGNKRSHILKQTCSWKVQACLIMCDLFVTARH